MFDFAANSIMWMIIMFGAKSIKLQFLRKNIFHVFSLYTRSDLILWQQQKSKKTF